jgi:hypothetical protein
MISWEKGQSGPMCYNDLCRVDALPGLVWSALADGDVDYPNQRWCE